MNVLVVDDETIVARALSRAFSAKGHTVNIAHSGEDGLDMWIQTAPDVILLDVVMPGLTGPQVIEEYKKRNKVPSTRVILMTAHSGIKGKDAALDLGADDFILKPFENIMDLVSRIEKLVKGK